MENPDRKELQQDMIVQGKTEVHHYWKKETDRNRWRIWDNLNSQTRDQTTTTAREVEEELRKRKIAVSEEEDQLRWGWKNGREFNLKEARYYIMDQDQENLAQQWNELWSNP
jgi:hypothetical protein